MELFKFPHTAKVNKIIPKNAFDLYTNAKQKKLFTELVSRITWIAKLSKETVNLEPKDIIEIQIFKIELKRKVKINQLLNIIDKSIPYHIIFVVEFENKSYITTSTKHTHPINPDNAVIDWTFKSEWFTTVNNVFKLELKRNLDTVYHSFCKELSAENKFEFKNLKDLVDHKRQVDALQREISHLQSSILNSKQFNQKVELNLKLKDLEKKLQIIINATATVKRDKNKK